MTQKVSFRVAKVLKEAGYPQETEYWYSKDGEFCYSLSDLDELGYISAPTYIDAWLWLWKVKKICINCNLDKYNLIPQWWCSNEDGINYNTPNFDGPEEAIANAIEYLVENDLIK